ncbi:MAG: hypothetical protein EOM12_00895 [Verrucomicrobiae bacterium]|nr:hypothetical protein [Verrucomicrobiae bacterium]
MRRRDSIQKAALFVGVLFVLGGVYAHLNPEKIRVLTGDDIYYYRGMRNRITPVNYSEKESMMLGYLSITAGAIFLALGAYRGKDE